MPDSKTKSTKVEKPKKERKPKREKLPPKNINRSLAQTKNIEKGNLWKELKNQFKGKMEDFKNRNYKFGDVKIIKHYIEELNDNPPKENLITVMKDQAKNIINPNFPSLKIKLNLSKNKMEEVFKDLWKNKTEQIFNVFGNIEKLTIRDEFINSVMEGLKNLSLKTNEKYLLKLTTTKGIKKITTLNANNINRWRGIIQNRVWISENDKPGSENLKEIDGEEIAKLELEKIETEKTESRKYNGFFPYVNISDIDISKHGIYTDAQLKMINGENHKSCLIRSLENCGIDKGKISDIVQTFPMEEENFPLSKMKEVSKIIGKNIILHYYYEQYNRIDKLKYITDKENPENLIELSQYKNHIFNFEKTEYSSMYLSNKDIIDVNYKNNPERFKFNKKRANGNFYFIKTREAYVNSLNLVVLMMENQMFNEYSSIYHLNRKINNAYKAEPTITNAEESQEEVENVEIIEISKENKDQAKIDRKEEFVNILKNKDKQLIIYADCETQVVGCEYHHILAFSYMHDDEIKTFKNNGNVNFMISELRTSLINLAKREKAIIYDYKSSRFIQNKKIKMIFHNAKYDSKIIERYFYSASEVCKDGRLYSKDFNLCKGVKFSLLDFYKHFGKPLKKAPETFGLTIEKMPGVNYGYYCPEKMNNHLVSISEYKNGVKPGDREGIMETITSNRIFEYQTTDDGIEVFNPVAFYLYYLEIDVKVLKMAVEKYRSLLFELTAIDPTDSLTISTVGYKFANNEGAFNGLYRVGGSLREYIQKSIRGGRVYVNPDYIKTVVEEEIADFDGVSLYPSAIVRLCREYGLPIGKAKSSTETNYEFYKNKSWYVVRIELKSINKRQMIPMINIKEDNQDSARYVNAIENPTIQYVDKITLEDWIRFHDIDYEIKDGIYWNSGYNKRLGEVIQMLFDERLKYKDLKNEPMQEMIKLILNSIYGKTGTRKSTTQTKFISKDKINDFMFSNFGLIKEIEENQYNFKITISAFDNSTSLNFVASAILSMSKRIMQEIFDIANDCNFPIYYTDTDSIHMLKSDIEPLSIEFKNRYNRVLVGSQMGQFHNDFKMDGCKNIDSLKFIACGPKSYIDLIQGTDKITGELKQDVHIKLKGITKAGIEDKIKMIIYKNKDIKKIYKKDKEKARIMASIRLFELLAKGQKFRFYLNPTEFDPSFEFTKDGVRSRGVGEFSRDVCFLDNKALRKLELLNVEGNN